MQVMASPALGVACAPVVARARGHFAASEAIMAAAPRRMVRTPRIMAAAYSAILMRTVARGWQPPRARVSLPRHEKLWILLRYAIV
jgi:phytoene synthase